jgi:hypothetical protein
MRSLITVIVLITFMASNSNAELYGKLLSRNGKYEFEKISNVKTNENLVDLSNNSPVNYYTPAKEGCVSTIWDACGYKKCKDGDFVDNKTKVSNIAFLYTIGLIILPLTVICGGVVIPSEVNFNFDTFHAAVNEGRVNSDLENIKKEYEIFESKVSTNGNNVNSKWNESSAIYHKYLNEFSSNVSKMKKEIKVFDQSGFWRKDPSTLVNVDFDGFDFKNSFSSTRPTLRTAISEHPRRFIETLKNMEAENSLLTSDAITNIELDLKKYEEKASKSAQYVNTINNSNISYDGFNYKVMAPDKVYFNSSHDKLTIMVQIDTKDFKGVYPFYSNSDKNMSIVSDNNSIKFSNNTDDFIQLHSVSIYYGAEITTVSMKTPIELPPRSEQLKPLIMFTLDVKKGVGDYPHQTKSTAKKTYFEYGIAAKYRVVNQNIDKTLFATKKYNLLDVVDGKL